MKRIPFPVSVFVLSIASTAVFAQAPASAPAAAAPTGYRAEVISDIEGIGKKLVDLATAMPAEKYGWRPAPGVRSVSEVYMHVVGANYLLPSFLGAKLPEGFDREMEKSVTDKAKVIEWLKKSIENAKAAVLSASDADLDKKVKAFGREMTERRVLMIVQTHMHEHLGQSIAYARSNGVTPPWSEAGEQPPAKKG
jgi:uncharacterized damage-inducible protein DinB